MIEIDIERDAPMEWNARSTPPKTTSPPPATLRVIDAYGRYWRREYPGSFTWNSENTGWEFEWSRLLSWYSPVRECASEI